MQSGWCIIKLSAVVEQARIIGWRDAEAIRAVQ